MQAHREAFAYTGFIKDAGGLFVMFHNMLAGYNRQAALEYSNFWALRRNPQYYDYSDLGGDCTNFISQCIYAGSGVMNYNGDAGWYYRNGNDKAPAWTAARFLYPFLTGNFMGPGPYGMEADVSRIEAGDIVQLAFQDPGIFTHSLFVAACGSPATMDNIRINTHTYDRLNYPLIQYSWSGIRFIKILGVRIQ
jgi:hypothetical protein